jgi:hypothetical protein
LKAEVYKILSQTSGSRIEVDYESIRGLVQGLSEAENLVFEVMQDL